jgi:hypothetical protein
MANDEIDEGFSEYIFTAKIVRQAADYHSLSETHPFAACLMFICNW